MLISLWEKRRKVTNSFITYECEPWAANVHPNKTYLSLIPTVAFSKGNKHLFFLYILSTSHFHIWMLSLDQFIRQLLLVNTVHYAEIEMVWRGRKIFSRVFGLGFLKQLRRSPQHSCDHKDTPVSSMSCRCEELARSKQVRCSVINCAKYVAKRGLHCNIQISAAGSCLIHSQSLESPLPQPCHVVP